MDTQTEELSTSRTAPRVRAPRFRTTGVVPRDWLAGSRRATRLVDALSLVFPDGERFFIRSVQHYAHVFDTDPALRARVRGFFGQEARHGHAHEQHNGWLAAQGYDVSRFLRTYRRLAWEGIEPACPPALRLSITVALEHLTATLATVALEGPVLDDAHPEVRALLRWHALEEIEHKSVAFDVLARVDPRLRTRAAGLAGGLAVLALFWALAYAELAAADRRLPETPPPADGGRAARAFRGAAIGAFGRVGQAIVAYLQPGFHPDAEDERALVGAALTELGLADRGLAAEG